MRSEANEERLRCACVVVVSFICLLFCSGSNSFAQDNALRKINWGMTALSAAMWIPWLAKEARIYEKNGLDVDIVTAVLTCRVSRSGVIVSDTLPAQIVLFRLDGARHQKRCSAQFRAHRLDVEPRAGLEVT